jgi:Ca-activated chloride channel family protein
VNRFLLDSMAKYGRGEVEYLALNDDGSAAARRMHERIRNPLLTDISVDWNGLAVSDVYPKTIPDLFSAKPVILTGRYSGNSKGTIRLKGKMSGRDFVREIPVDFSSAQTRDVLATLWARTRVDDLMSKDFNGVQQGNMKDDVKQSIVQLGLDYRLMTQFTSFVAVEEMIVTDGGVPRRIDVPVEVPEGVNRQGVFGEENRPINGRGDSNFAFRAPMPSTTRKVKRSGGGGGGGIGTGSGGGIAPTSRKPMVAESLGVVDEDAALSPAEKARRELQSKLHPAVLAVIDRLKNKTAATAGEAKFIRGGKAEIQIWLDDKSEATIAKLKELGFEVVLDPTTSKMIIGRLPIEKLAALAELKSIRYVAPQTSGK